MMYGSLRIVKNIGNLRIKKVRDSDKGDIVDCGKLREYCDLSKCIEQMYCVLSKCMISVIGRKREK
ncbi:unnamed protein product [Meloidogyne enterolobii]|uniref:Uncharacterized protein n=1 Tax=Meloidogyne enterolobii TaxID=390850 RepID=A0ACB0Y147_MELEN